MKSFFLTSVLVGFCLHLPTSAFAGEFAEPKLVQNLFSESYIPKGFDNNDLVQIVAEGVFSNGCYKPGKIAVHVDENKKVIHVDPYAYIYSGLCIQVMVPYHQVLDIGILRGGNYKIIQGATGKDLGALTVRSSTQAAADDYLYAPISQAYISQKDGRSYLTLSGEFSNSCLKLDKVVVDLQPKVVVVQPIANMSGTSDCQAGVFAFEKTVEIKNMPKGRFLLHVRSLNAKSVNNLFDIL